ncbi:tyrosine-type recombinase/integrase [Corynebacterium marinum]|uniref:Tyr recombinase domain-containing protein n=1 Tax=Corynebacterium marinum DSM 44953 TaxID=1224162 RepID=A0A0B6TTV4_9CORY|nr:tyrosine-type recombinase/integrase [Corynebacterium marinum]AJK69025.1 hypothetical protein B840_07100 [Corynebacterium marinum DSM 44953]GGO18058.1 hypothetical protein GCM10010980_15980 [Corynebacterium marinum]
MAKFGNVRTLPSGKFQARYTGPDGLAHKAPATFHLKGEAYGWLEGEQRLIYLGAWTSPAQRLAEAKAEEERDSLTVKVWLADWLDRKEREGLKPSTMAKYRERIERRVTGDELPKSIREFASLPVADVTATQARLWWTSVEEHWPDSGEMNSKAYQHMRSAFAYLVDEERIPANPIVIKAARRKPKPILQRDLLDIEELTALYRESPDRYRLITALTLFHGLRLGEALALKRKNVIVERVAPAGGGMGPVDLRISVRVEDNVQRIDGEMVSMGSPKTGAGVRTVPVFRAFHADVCEHLKAFTGPKPEDLATTTRTGKPVMDTSYRSVLNGMRERAGVEKRVHAHAGRRYITTALLEQGVEPQVVGEIIGDKDLTTVLEVYAQVRAGRTDEVMEQLGRGVRL